MPEYTFSYNPPAIDWLMVAPIASVCVAGMLALILEMLKPKGNNNMVVVTSLLGLAVSFAALSRQFDAETTSTLHGLLIRDGFSTAVQSILVIAAALTILFSEGYLKEKRIPFGEFYPLVLWSTAGAMVMVTTTNLLVMFVGLEMLSIALYVLAGMSRKEEKSEESALKYFLLGAFASAFLLYGIAFLYGASGSIDINQMAPAFVEGAKETKGLVLFGGALVIIGLGFKSSFVPFHQWTPDVYQGAPTNVAAFMASASKVAALATLWRFMSEMSFTPELANFFLPVLFWIAVLTMTIGNFAALVQKDLKRVLGYSSISHAGYVLVGICANLKDPINTSSGSVLFYLLAYTMTTIGAFAVVSLVARNGKESTSIKDLYGLRLRSPLAAVVLVIFMVSLLGMPPTAGFWGKWVIFRDALTAGMPSLAIVLAVNSAVSAYYYLGIAWAAMVPEPDRIPVIGKLTPGFRSTALICAAGTLLIWMVFNLPLFAPVN
jgi:NADH-quinone oxidoreductase subunit N